MFSSHIQILLMSHLIKWELLLFTWQRRGTTLPDREEREREWEREREIYIPFGIDVKPTQDRWYLLASGQESLSHETVSSSLILQHLQNIDNFDSCKKTQLEPLTSFLLIWLMTQLPCNLHSNTNLSPLLDQPQHSRNDTICREGTIGLSIGPYLLFPLLKEYNFICKMYSVDKQML